MIDSRTKAMLEKDGFAILPSLFSEAEVAQLVGIIDKANAEGVSFRKTSDLFAIRQLFKELPALIPVVLNDPLKALIQNIAAQSFVVKAIYFDKPEASNWFVPLHQDITISVDRKAEIEQYGPWIVRHNQYTVQPPVNVLENIFTLRIHFDDTDETNGALKVIPGSHLKGIQSPESIDWEKEEETICHVPKGGVMLMKPLLFHSSGRSTSNNKRRVIHIECTYVQLPGPLQWAEQQVIV
jgi:ectoine hydroxylase-related dioxygenase (phytanoyl-CoA dioxygenase family)